MKNNIENVQCPKCKMEVNSEATICPHCRSKIRKPMSKIVKIFLGILLGVFIISMVASDSAPTPTVTPEQSFVAMKEHAIYSFSKSYITDTLKSPSTAKFSYTPVTKQDEKEKNVFEVISHVDSQNGFGAMIRNNWTLKARYVGADDRDSIETGENWKIIEVYFGGEKIK